MPCTTTPTDNNLVIDTRSTRNASSINDIFVEWMLAGNGPYDYATDNCTTLTFQQCRNLKAVHFLPSSPGGALTFIYILQVANDQVNTIGCYQFSCKA